MKGIPAAERNPVDQSRVRGIGEFDAVSLIEHIIAIHRDDHAGWCRRSASNFDGHVN
jgi:hypothetical protein